MVEDLDIASQLIYIYILSSTISVISMINLCIIFLKDIKVLVEVLVLTLLVGLDLWILSNKCVLVVGGISTLVLIKDGFLLALVFELRSLEGFKYGSFAKPNN